MVEVVAEGAWHRAVRIAGRPVVLRVTATDSDALAVEVHGSAAHAEMLPTAIAIVERVFGTGIDTARLEAAVASDPVFLAVARRFRGLRPLVIADPFETLVWAILGQQINVVFAAKLKRALIEHHGERVTALGRDFLLFPAPAALLDLEHDRDLRPLQFSRQKSEYTVLAARAVHAGALDLEGLRQLSPEAAIARLMTLKGIGRWTAEYVLMRGLGFSDVIVAGDGGLRRVIGRDYGLGRLATEAEVRTLAEHWSGWRSFASLYWWFVLQLERDERTAHAVSRANRTRTARANPKPAD